MEKRAARAASLSEPNLQEFQGQPSLAWQLLERYGDRQDVTSNLSANFDTDGWSGHASEHYLGKAESLKRTLERNVPERVRNWLEHYVRQLETNAQTEKMREERA